MKLIRRGLKKVHFGTNNKRHTLLVSGYVTCCNKFFRPELSNDLSITAMESYIFAWWPCCFRPLTRNNPVSKLNVSLNCTSNRSRGLVAETIMLYFCTSRKTSVPNSSARRT